VPAAYALGLSPGFGFCLDELRGRIEILMDEIESSLGIEPTPIFTVEDLDTGPAVQLSGVPPGRWTSKAGSLVGQLRGCSGGNFKKIVHGGVPG